MRKAYIYKITNPKGKIYIGSTFYPKKRWGQHKTQTIKCKSKLGHSILKYGGDLHIFEVIAECTQEDRNKQECYYGNLFYVLSTNGLNCTLPNEDEKFCSVSEETREKWRIASSNKKHTKESKEKIRAANVGRVFSKETIEKMKISGKKRIMTKEHRDKITASLKGKKRSIEAINKTAMNNTGKKRSSDVLKAMSERMKGNIVSEETKLKMSISRTGLKRTEEQRIKMSGGGNPKAKKVICIETKEIWGCAKDAAAYFGFNKGTLINRLNGRLKNNTTLRYL